ncbi:MAG: hypothetical protein GTO24_21865 [candidate division Zixibacteria bacterium]|nr:hypothetical protein [candidate division Zixibacteria bacterium]
MVKLITLDTSPAEVSFLRFFKNQARKTVRTRIYLDLNLNLILRRQQK